MGGFKNVSGSGDVDVEIQAGLGEQIGAFGWRGKMIDLVGGPSRLMQARSVEDIPVDEAQAARIIEGFEPRQIERDAGAGKIVVERDQGVGIGKQIGGEALSIL